MRRDQEILLKHHQVALPPEGEEGISKQHLATLLSNIAYYGYALSQEAVELLKQASQEGLESWWRDLERSLKVVTGDDKKMDDFVVYKNFPQEVLDLTEAEYWGRQILMYWGLPNAWFVQEAQEREAPKEAGTPRVLRPAGEDALARIYKHALAMPSRWTEAQWADVHFLAVSLCAQAADLSQVSFKENLVQLASFLYAKGLTFRLSSATDVLRLAVGLSEGDVSLRTESKFRSFRRKERRFLLALLEEAKQLEEDLARRKELWKKLLYALKPGDYARRFPRVVAAYDKLYRGVGLETFSSRLEAMLERKDAQALVLLQARPGEFLRRLLHCLKVYGPDAALAFMKVLPRLRVSQLLKLQSHLETFGKRKYRTFAPRGNWTKVQIFERGKEKEGRQQRRSVLKHQQPPLKNTALQEKLQGLLALAKPAPKTQTDQASCSQKTRAEEQSTSQKSPKAPKRKPYIGDLLGSIAQELKSRLCEEIPSVHLAKEAKYIKLPSNTNELSHYGRGTVFPIPEEVKFIRTASYWRVGGPCGNVWFDNGWNFFGPTWKPAGVCCWNRPYYNGEAAIFSGDPTSSKELEGRACQMIDLYLDRLVEQGIRYAVWNILCYSRKSFNEVGEVYAALQWGEDAQAGKLFAPSRCQLSFPVRGDNYAKYIVTLDLHKRQIVYIDANLYAQVHSAEANEQSLAKTMPAFCEYLTSLPSVYDLFKHLPQSTDGVPVLYSDSAHALQDQVAYVFRPENQQNTFQALELSPLLSR